MLRFFDIVEHFDWVLFIAVLALTSLGLVTIYGISISQELVGLFTFYKQLAALGIGISLVAGLTFLDYRHLKSFGFLAFLSGAIILILVLFLGETVRGTRGWFQIGSLSFQPVELAKLSLILYISALFSRMSHGRLSWRIFGLSACATMTYVGLVLLQPDFGSAMVMLGSWIAMCCFAGLPRKAWIILPLCCLVAGGLFWSFGVKTYQRERILTFLNPAADPHGAGYNAAQARIAIGSGGWLGKGIGEGSQARLRFLPEAATDFIFAVIGEELGFVGISMVLGLSFVLYFRFLTIARESEDEFATFVLIGLGSVFLIHMFVNAGMNLSIVPITGIPMPFLSAAASSLVVTYVSIGLAQSIAVRRSGKAKSEQS
ncbi:MAG: FtsW/RodA/SpoVE family cell cycle protein [Patescibacteria group bacterium]